MRLSYFTSISFSLFLLAGCAILKDRSPASIDVCRENGVGCPFLIIGHRGAPLVEAENTIPAYEAAIRLGANALEIDLVMTAEGEVAVYHDRDPNSLIALVRQTGLENQKYVPWVPNIGSGNRLEVEKLTLDELREFYGYALNKGVIKDILTENQKDTNAIIPTIEDFANWGNKQEVLEAVFLDIKLVPGQEKRAAIIADKFASAFAKSHYRVYMMTQYESIYAALQVWINAHPSAPNRFLTLDMEEAGAMAKSKTITEKIKRKVKSLSMGSTIFRGWDGYINELGEVLNRARRRRNIIYPVVAWTIDNERKLYQLLQMGVDGILTNRADRLFRLVNRHWKDHSTAAKTLANCYTRAKTEHAWKVCGSGPQISPLGAIDQEDIRNWVCDEAKVHPTLKDFYGCGGVFDKVNIRFSTKIEDDPRVIMYMNPSGHVNVVNLPAPPKESDQIIFMEYHQTKCDDGILNNKCEYQLDLEYDFNGKWVRVQNIPAFKDSFNHYFVIPKAAKVIRLSLSETDDGIIDDKAVYLINPSKPSTVNVAGPKKRFNGSVTLFPQDLGPWMQRNNEITPLALEFLQKKCYDGVLNYKCEYKVEVELMNREGKISKLLGHDEVMKDSFVVYADVPNDTTSLKVTVKEMDENEVSATSQFVLENVHGENMQIQSSDDTFKGVFTVKHINYDETQEHSEGDEDFKPHDQDKRASKKLFELRMP